MNGFEIYFLVQSTGLIDEVDLKKKDGLSTGFCLEKLGGEDTIYRNGEVWVN